MARVALLINGGFLRAALHERLDRAVGVEDIRDVRQSILELEPLRGAVLFRCYYYDAPPLHGVVTNPVDGSRVDLGSTAVARGVRRLLDRLEAEPGFAVRRGVLRQQGWVLGKAAEKSRRAGPRSVEARDLVPSIAQSGVVSAMALDVATISLKRLAEILVVVTGDAALVPALRFAREEGLLVYTYTAGRPICGELGKATDLVLMSSR